jgi:adenylate cyclase
MADEGERKLAAILSADVAGYSKLMGDDERATVLTLTDYRKVFSDHIERHKGRVVDSTGDNLLAEFASPVEAVDAAIDIQHELGRRNRQLAEHRQMQFRIGINLGDILSRDDGTIYGNGVNVAARLESLAEPGGIMISESAQMQVRTLIGVGIADAGEHEVKNIAEPVHAYRIVLDGTAPNRYGSRKVSRSFVVTSAVTVFLIAIVAAVVFRPSGEPEAPILTKPTGPSIAVLPFDNLSGNPEQDYFADGMTEDIITGLSRFRDLFVIARNSTFQYKGQAVDVREVGRELGVRFVLEGSIRREADNIRVTAQLIDTASGGHVWAENFDRKLSAGSVFAIQDEVSENVVAQIADAYGAISELRKSEARSAPPGTLGAYECVLLTYEFFRVLNAEMHAKSRDCLESAVEVDPNYADAWAWLVAIYNEEYVDAFNPLPNSLDRALDAGFKALELDANNQVAHWYLAWNYYFRRDQEKFEQHADRALTINPNNATMLAELSMPFAWSGNIEKATGMVSKAMRINPRFPGFYYFTLYHIHAVAGDYEQAAADAERLGLPGLFWMHAKAATAYGHLGRTDDGRAVVRKLLDLYPNFATKALEELEGLYWPDPGYIDRYIDGLRMAGLDIPDEPTAAD